MAGLRLVTPEQLLANEQQQATEAVAAEDAANQNSRLTTSLVAFIDNEFSRFKRHRDSASGWSDRLTNAMRVFSGVYDVQKLQEIRKFGGSEIYARMTAGKCRGATSLLRDIYLNQEKPWGLKPTPDPKLPDDIAAQVTELVQLEAMNAMKGMGAPPSPDQITDRAQTLMASAARAAIKKARMEAEEAFNKLDDILVEGNFYKALEEFLTDLPLFPFACIKGPVVRIEPRITWREGKAVTENKPKMFWNRVSPFRHLVDAGRLQHRRRRRHRADSCHKGGSQPADRPAGLRSGGHLRGAQMVWAIRLCRSTGVEHRHCTRPSWRAAKTRR